MVSSQPMVANCQHCGGQLAVGAVACFRCGRMVARAEEPGTGASVVIAPTHMGTVAKSELLEGQWRLVKLLGQGAVGQVWQAHDVTLDRPVAVKMMHEAVAADPAQVARFEREARVLAGLEHPNLLPVLGIGRFGARPFLVTRLLEGRTLAELIHQRGGKLPPSEVARVLAPICDALTCLHDANVVHRDLKPSNIFVGDDRRVTLMDLGSAHEAGSELTHFGEVLGTQGYLAPEQKLGKRGLTGKTDVYALGCLMIEMLSGKLTTEVTAAIPGVPVPLAALARAALSVSADARPTALEVRAGLVPYLVSEEVTTPNAAPLKLEPPTQHVVFTPTTGSPSYPDLRAISVTEKEKETREAPRAFSVEPRVSDQAPPAGATVVRAISDIPVPLRASAPRPAPDGPTGPSLAPLRDAEGSTRLLTALAPRRPRLSRNAVVILMAGGLLIIGAFAIGLGEPPAEVPPPQRIDHPGVIVSIQKDEDLKVVRFTDTSKATARVANIIERKNEANGTYGFEKREVRKPNRTSVRPGLLRVTTTIDGFVVPAVLWVKRSPKQKVYELVGQTPVELEVVPGELAIRLQYQDDPFIFLPYRVLPRKDWPKEQGGMRLELAVRKDSQPVPEVVSHGEPMAPRVSNPATSDQPITKPRGRGGR